MKKIVILSVMAWIAFSAAASNYWPKTTEAGYWPSWPNGNVAKLPSWPSWPIEPVCSWALF